MENGNDGVENGNDGVKIGNDGVKIGNDGAKSENNGVVIASLRPLRLRAIASNSLGQRTLTTNGVTVPETVGEK